MCDEASVLKSNLAFICVIAFLTLISGYRERDFIQERESLMQQQAEKDQQYDALVKSLKDRVRVTSIYRAKYLFNASSCLAFVCPPYDKSFYTEIKLRCAQVL